MYTAGDIYRAVDELAPFGLAESWDNVGLLVGSRDKAVSRVLLALDVTPRVLEEAVSTGADLILTHHPVIFKPLARVDGDSIVYKLIRGNIAVISAHTNLDIAKAGVNDCLAARLRLANLRPLDVVSERPFYKVIAYVPSTHVEAVYAAMSEAGGGSIGNYSGCGFLKKGEGRFLPGEKSAPYIGTKGTLEMVEETAVEMVVDPDKLDGLLSAMKQAHPYEEPAYDVYNNHALKQKESLGRVGDLAAPMDPDTFAGFVKEMLGAGGVKYTVGGEKIRTVAVCGGNGADYIGRAKELGAQALVTGESKHNLLLDAARLGMTLVDAGHFNTETVVLAPLMERLRERLPGIEMEIAGANVDEVRYL